MTVVVEGGSVMYLLCTLLDGVEEVHRHTEEVFSKLGQFHTAGVDKWLP